MKKLLICFLLLAPSFVFSQSRLRLPAYDDIYMGNKKKKNLTAGEHLKKSANLFYIGMGLTAVSTVPIFLAVADYNTTEEVENTHPELNYVASGVLAFSGIVCFIVGINHIKLAGKTLDIQFSKNTLGLAMKF